MWWNRVRRTKTICFYTRFEHFYRNGSWILDDEEIQRGNSAMGDSFLSNDISFLRRWLTVTNHSSARQRSCSVSTLLLPAPLTDHSGVLTAKLFPIDWLLTCVTQKTRMMELLSVELAENLSGEKWFLADSTMRSMIDMAGQAVEATILLTKETFTNQQFGTLSTTEAITMVHIWLIHR